MKARDIYTSTLFKCSLEYAYSLDYDKIYILSAKYHLLNLDEIIDPYNVTLSYIAPKKRKSDLTILDEKQKKIWGKNVCDQLDKVADIENDNFIILAGKEYISPLKDRIKNLDDRLLGMRNGERIKWLKTNKL